MRKVTGSKCYKCPETLKKITDVYDSLLHYNDSFQHQYIR